MVCADGFVQKPFCRGQAGCHACGNISDKATPLCLRDELPSHMVTDGGNPLFYKVPNAQVTGDSPVFMAKRPVD